MKGLLAQKICFKIGYNYIEYTKNECFRLQRNEKQFLTSLSRTEDRPFRLEEMIAAVAIEQARRKKKGKAFHCFVVAHNKLINLWVKDKKSGSGTLKAGKDSQIIYLLKHLKELRGKYLIPEGMRAQILVMNEGH